MRVNGSCHCGAITFDADIDPEKVRICHCTDCQQLSGTAFRVMVPCSESDFHLRTGEPKIYVKMAESGRRRQQAFCGNCGSPIYATSDEPKGARSLGLRIGVLAQDGSLCQDDSSGFGQFFHGYRHSLAWLKTELPISSSAGSTVLRWIADWPLMARNVAHRTTQWRSADISCVCQWSC